MVDMALIQGAITSLKTATDIANGFLKLKSIAGRAGKGYRVAEHHFVRPIERTRCQV